MIVEVMIHLENKHKKQVRAFIVLLVVQKVTYILGKKHMELLYLSLFFI